MIVWTQGQILLFILCALVPVVLYDVLKMQWLHVPWLPLGLLGTAVAFIIGFKNNASYDRLWEARKIWGGIVNTSRSFTIMVKDFIKGEDIDPDELKSVHRELVHRHVAWLTALRYQLRSFRPWENGRRATENRNLHSQGLEVAEEQRAVEDVAKEYISDEEIVEIFVKSNPASQLIGIQSRRLRELKERQLIAPFEYVELQRSLTELYALQGQSERIKNFPYPRQFATLNFIFVWLFILLLPYGVMEEFEKIGDHILSELPKMQDGQASVLALWSLIGEHFVWFSIPFTALISWVFFALEIVGEHSENPFEGGPNDVPITDLSRSIEIDIRQLIDDDGIPQAHGWGDVVL